MVHKLAREGIPIKIVHQTGLSRGLVQQIVRGEREDIFRIRESNLTPWLPRLERDWSNGYQNGAELWRRLRADSFQRSVRVVSEWARRQRRAEQAIPDGASKPPPARRIARLMTIARDHLGKADAVLVARNEAALPSLFATRLLVDKFNSMVRNGTPTELGAWLDDAETSMIASFARGLRKDQAAVAAALRDSWSNGQTQGQINRLKSVKGQMYGRARIETQKPRILFSS